MTISFAETNCKRQETTFPLVAIVSPFVARNTRRIGGHEQPRQRGMTPRTLSYKITRGAAEHLGTRAIYWLF